MPVVTLARSETPTMRTPLLSATARRRHPDRRGGFTLIEIMIAAGIIVLMISMALPVFRAITGSRSEEGTTNLIAAQLGRARADAVGLHRPAGVAFVYNAAKQTTYMAEVQFRDCQYWSPGVPYVRGNYVKVAATPAVGSPAIDYFYLALGASTGSPPPSPSPPSTPPSNGIWQCISGPPLDIAADTDLVPLPTGVGVQTVCNCTYSGGVRTSDGYLSVGAILFDVHGRVTGQPYEMDDINNNTATLLNKAGFAGKAFPNVYVYAPLNTSAGSGASAPGRWGVESQYGLVVYQRAAYDAQGFTYADPLYTTGTASTPPADYVSASPSQQAAEQWLDINATPLLIDRYTGELVRTQ